MREAILHKLAARWRAFFGGPFRRIIRGRDGAVAVEFALVALPFFALVFAILETALLFFLQQTLEYAAADAGRLILTGQAQGATGSSTTPLTQSGFQAAACAAMSNVMGCSTNLFVDVQTYSSFSNAVVTPPATDPKTGNPQTSFSMGAACDIVVVRLMYKMPIAAPGFSFGLPSLILATGAFRNEPYSGGTPC